MATNYKPMTRDDRVRINIRYAEAEERAARDRGDTDAAERWRTEADYLRSQLSKKD